MVLKPMLAKDGKCSDAKDESKIKQIKFDGTRTFLLKDDNKIRLMGARNWKNDYAKNHPDLAAEAKKISAKHVVLDCELTYFKKGTQQDMRTCTSAFSAKQLFWKRCAFPREKVGVSNSRLYFEFGYGPFTAPLITPIIVNRVRMPTLAAPKPLTLPTSGISIEKLEKSGATTNGQTKPLRPQTAPR